MACEHLEDGRLVRCRAVRGTLIPSHHEREHYCRAEDPSRCPTRTLFARLQIGPLPEEAYWSLWVPNMPMPELTRTASATEPEPPRIAVV